jgi:hypothetical protein
MQNKFQRSVPKSKWWIIFCPPSISHWGAMCPIPLNVTSLKLFANYHKFPAFWGPLSAYVVNHGRQYWTVGNCNYFLNKLTQNNVPLVGTAGSLSPE